MTVKELIKELQKFDPDQLVVYIEYDLQFQAEVREIGQTTPNMVLGKLTDKPVVYLESNK